MQAGLRPHSVRKHLDRLDPFTGKLSQEKLVKARQQQAAAGLSGEVARVIAAKICQQRVERATCGE